MTKPHIIYKDGRYWIFKNKTLGRDFFTLKIRTYFSCANSLDKAWTEWQRYVAHLI